MSLNESASPGLGKLGDWPEVPGQGHTFRYKDYFIVCGDNMGNKHCRGRLIGDCSDKFVYFPEQRLESKGGKT